MRYQSGGVVQIKTNLILWYPYIVGPLELYIMPSEDVSKTAKWDTYKVNFLRNPVSATKSHNLVPHNFYHQVSFSRR